MTAIYHNLLLRQCVSRNINGNTYKYGIWLIHLIRTDFEVTGNEKKME
jgi:hypothetical protein